MFLNENPEVVERVEQVCQWICDEFRVMITLLSVNLKINKKNKVACKNKEIPKDDVFSVKS